MLTNKQRFLKLHNLPKDSSLSMEQMSELSGFPVDALIEVYEKGLGAWSTSIQSVRTKGTFKKGEDKPRSQKLSADQWAMARVYSFVMKRKSTFGGSDNDIAVRYGL